MKPIEPEKVYLIAAQINKIIGYQLIGDGTIETLAAFLDSLQ